MKQFERAIKALDAAGATLKRAKKHLVFELPNGKNVVVPKSPSDHRAEENALRDIRKAVGLPRETKPPADPRERLRKPGRKEPDWLRGLPANSSQIATSLRRAGPIEQQLRSQIGQLEATIRAKDEQIAALESLPVVRAWRAIHRKFTLLRRA